ncbi:hypothetical protein TSH100_14915 [Azospirillum sp. TSH100]|uniref:hypothetical protein n=1 Tax=Azospirillum sp. TSH100 TaxID=652764 RepID=UPI000D6090A4|nr:hypothetical protein [Azospirillum sp. TSH100]PWC85858.1 hypothetical protein TSH100_14915 [Azospirillum sp. TSH100]QCG87913.1 hypothetical protein E6C72_09380 [Azospirillum sp. TSH100]
MFIDATNPMRDAIETIRATDVISDAKKHILFQGLEALRNQHCPDPRPMTGCCEDCLSRTRCLTAVVDLLGS